MAGTLMRVHLLSTRITHQWLISRNEQGGSPSWIKRFFNFPCGQSSRKPHTIACFLFLVVLHFLTPPSTLVSLFFSCPFASSSSAYAATHARCLSPTRAHLACSLITSPHRSALGGAAHNWLGSSVVLGRVRLQVQIPRRALLYTIRSPANLKGPEPQYTAAVQIIRKAVSNYTQPE